MASIATLTRPRGPGDPLDGTSKTESFSWARTSSGSTRSGGWRLVLGRAFPRTDGFWSKS
eukprot:8760467-Pyramimonas_sp.AAC.1